MESRKGMAIGTRVLKGLGLLDGGEAACGGGVGWRVAGENGAGQVSERGGSVVTGERALALRMGHPGGCVS